jgi:hypothetical protein
MEEEMSEGETDAPGWLWLVLSAGGCYVHLMAAATLFYYDLWSFGLACSAVAVILFALAGCCISAMAVNERNER